MFTPLPKKRSCACQGCRCNYTDLLLVESLLYPAAVPGGVAVPSTATGQGSLLVTNKDQFYVHLGVRNIHEVTMSHIHFRNTKDPQTNGPILLVLNNNTKNPIRSLDGTLVSRMFTTQDFEAPYTHMSMDDFRDLLVHNKLYFNVHTVKNPNGELAAPMIPALQFAS